MASTAALDPAQGRHGLDLHGVSRAAVYVLFAIGAVFTGVTASGSWLSVLGPHQQGLFSLASPESLLGNLCQAIAATGLFLANLAGVVGLARGREWGRQLLTYACGFWASTLVFLPVAVGVMFVLWHPYLPARPGQLVERVMAGIRDHASRAAGTSLTLTVLLALTTLVFVLHESALLLTNASSDSAAFVLAMAVFTAVEALVLGAAIVGVGRGLPWGRPVAVFACGMCLLSFLAYPLTVVILVILLRTRARASAPAR